jgi:hypothetical protein
MYHANLGNWRFLDFTPHITTLFPAYALVLVG